MPNTSKKPLIAVFGSKVSNNTMQGIRINYMTSLSIAGALPVLAPMYASKDDYRRLAELCDGFFFAGGVDIEPRRYGEATLPECGEIDLDRDESELSALEEIIKTKKPVLGICRGIQTLCVATGGTLIQDIPSAVRTEIVHSQKIPAAETSHTVTIKGGSLLQRITEKNEFAVNSFHHQAVKSTTLTVSAYAPDGVIEAIEDPSHPFFLGVQWHPEYMSVSDEPSARLFSAFVEATRR